MLETHRVARARDRGENRAEAEETLVWTVQPLHRLVEPDDARIRREDDIGREGHLLDRAVRHVGQEDVGPADQPQPQLVAALRREIDRDRALLVVEVVEVARDVITLAARRSRPAGAQRVRALRGLQADHISTRERERP